MINAKIRVHNIFWRGDFCCGERGVFLSGGVQCLCFGGGTFAVEKGVFFKWRDAKFVFRRGYFCYGGVQNFCLGGGTFVMEEGVFLNWRGAKCVFPRGYFCCGGGSVFELEGYSTICVLEGMWEEIEKVWFELWMMYHG